MQRGLQARGRNSWRDFSLYLQWRRVIERQGITWGPLRACATWAVQNNSLQRILPVLGCTWILVLFYMKSKLIKNNSSRLPRIFSRIKKLAYAFSSNKTKFRTAAVLLLNLQKEPQKYTLGLKHSTVQAEKSALHPGCGSTIHASIFTRREW